VAIDLNVQLKLIFWHNSLLTKEFTPASQKNGGQALNLLTIALKTDSG